MSRADDPPVQPWPVLSEEAGPDLHLFRVRHDVVESPRTGQRMRALVLETPDWVNIVALTGDERLLLVRQFRFGSRAVSLEIPGGMVDRGEEPLAAARRELREETGYTAAGWRSVGVVEPNPAFHDNRCHTFLATGARPSGELRQDPGEHIEVVPTPVADVIEMVRRGEIQNSLVVAGLARVFDLRGE